MANEFLGNILIVNSFGSYTAGDKVEVFYDPDLDVISVFKNEIAITSGDSLIVTRAVNTTGRVQLINDTGADWTRSSVGYSVVIRNYNYNGNHVTITFNENRSFPYYLKTVTVNPPDPDPEDVNDIQITLVSTTKTTDTTTKDGVIEVLATRTNDSIGEPILYESGREPVQPNNGQDKGVFASLPRGKYTIYAVDNKGYSTSLTVTLISENEPHGVRWIVGFKNNDGDEGKLEILERSYIGATTEVYSGVTPYTHSTRGEGRDISDVNIVSSQVDVELIATTLDQYIDIANGDDDKYKVITYKKVAETWVETWRGFVNPESFSDAPNGLPYSTFFTATDRVADLKDRKFLYNEEYIKDGDNEYVSGDMSQLAVLDLCLNKTKLNQGFRIACNVFDASHSEAASPLAQTYINTDVYYDDKGVKTCLDVVKDILVIYDAMLVSWSGYWYIIRKKELLGVTVDYFEYDTDLAYVSAGSWNPRIDFKAATSSTRYRWVGGMSRNMTSVFRKVILTINSIVNDKGLAKSFNSANAVFDVWGNLKHMRGFTLWKSTTAMDQSLIAKTVNNKVTEYWRIKLHESGSYNTDTYIQWSKSIDYSTNDKMILSWNVNFKATYFNLTPNSKSFNDYPPYIPMKWVVKLGSNYLTTQGEWVASDPENEWWLDEFEGDKLFEKEFNLPDGNVASDTLQIKVYPISIGEHNIEATDGSDMIAKLKAEPTTDLRIGARRIVTIFESFEDVFYYYELSGSAADDDGVEVINPTDYTASAVRVWKLVTTYGRKNTLQVYSSTALEYIGLDFLPKGGDIPESIVTHNTNNDLNKIDYHKSINLFDLDNTINNDEKIFLNYTRLQNGTPTTVWHEAGAATLTKPLQDWLVQWIQRLTKKTRMIVSGTFFCDTEFTPINILNDPDDQNRLFYPNGISSSVKSRQYSGEVIEIGSDDTPTSSQFDLSVKQNQHK